MKAYFIDDDEVYKLVIKLIIKQSEFKDDIKFFDNGEQAIKELIANKNNAEALPTVILLDINMPVVDGWGFLDKFKTIKSELAKKIIIYMVSSSIDPDDVAQAKTYDEVAAYLAKPITLEEIRRMVAANPSPRKN